MNELGQWARADPDRPAVLLDSTVVSATSVSQKKATDPVLGRSWGGFSTKIHIPTDRQGCPRHLRVPDNQHHDRTQARALAEVWIGAPPSCLISDRADSTAFRVRLAQRGLEAVIQAWDRRTSPQPHDPERYPRNVVERGLSWLKGWWRVATHYNKHAYYFPFFLCLSGAWIWMESNVHTV